VPATKRTTKAEARRARAAAAREAARRGQRRKRLLAYGGVAAAVLVVAVAVTLVMTGRHPRPSNTASTPAAQPSAAIPAWPAPAPADVPAAVKAAGLPLLTMEATDVHFHAHLDILDNGNPVTVPAHIGLTPNSVSSMHTHDERGVIHIESPTAGRFTLGQFFTEWKQPLSASCVGTLCASTAKPLRFYLDGQPYTGDPTQIELKAHQEIAIVYGALPTGPTPPASFTFDPGE